MKNTQEIAQWIVDSCICIDTETTGLGENDVVIELAAIRIKTGEVLVDELVKPKWITHPQAAATHGITWEQQTCGGDLTQLFDKLFHSSRWAAEAFTAFNLNFDERMIRQTLFRSGIEAPPINEYAKKVREKHHSDKPIDKSQTRFRSTRFPDDSICIMELANRHFAKDHAKWDSEQSRFRRLSLARCCEIAGIEFEGQAHRAFADAKAAADLVTAIAEGRV